MPDLFPETNGEESFDVGGFMDIVEEVGGHRLNVKDFLVLREGDSVELVTLSHPDVINEFAYVCRTSLDKIKSWEGAKDRLREVEKEDTAEYAAAQQNVGIARDDLRQYFGFIRAYTASSDCAYALLSGENTCGSDRRGFKVTIVPVRVRAPAIGSKLDKDCAKAAEAISAVRDKFKDSKYSVRVPAEALAVHGSSCTVRVSHDPRPRGGLTGPASQLGRLAMTTYAASQAASDLQKNCGVMLSAVEDFMPAKAFRESEQAILASIHVVQYSMSEQVKILSKSHAEGQAPSVKPEKIQQEALAHLAKVSVTASEGAPLRGLPAKFKGRTLEFRADKSTSKKRRVTPASEQLPPRRRRGPVVGAVPNPEDLMKPSKAKAQFDARAKQEQQRRDWEELKAKELAAVPAKVPAKRRAPTWTTGAEVSAEFERSNQTAESSAQAAARAALEAKKSKKAKKAAVAARAAELGEESDESLSDLGILFSDEE